jgi:hypothetical protein
MRREESQAVEAIIRATYVMLLFSCPNKGMNIESLRAMCAGQANEPFLLSLRPDSERLRQLCRDFPEAFPATESKIISFYETVLSPTAQQVRSSSIVLLNACLLHPLGFCVQRGDWPWGPATHSDGGWILGHVWAPRSSR